MDINKINSIKNKELLWSILYDNGYFNNISNKNIQKIQEIFEDSILMAINNISNTNNTNNINNNNANNTNNNIIEINKLILSDIINKMKSFKEDKKMVEIDILKKDLDSFMNIKKPETIDFSDKETNDEALNGESLNTLLENLKMNRDNDFTNSTIEKSINITENSNNIIENSNISDIKENSNISDIKENSNISDIKENSNISDISDISDIKENFFIKNLDYHLNREYNYEKIINLSIKMDKILNKMDELEKDIKNLINR